MINFEMVETRVCKVCGKDFTQTDARQKICSAECRKVVGNKRAKAYYEKIKADPVAWAEHSARMVVYTRKWYRNNKERARELKRAWNEKNRDKLRVQNRLWQREWRRTHRERSIAQGRKDAAKLKAKRKAVATN